ncbi:MAG: DNA-binding HxlR family transcriptional regulator [Myxococcota bacterium]|jgi:DNA-binding HxlR family transcriptional regulator
MKSYKQFCGVAKALDRVGDRWTLLIARELLLGPRRYTDLLRALTGLTTNLLAARLRTLSDDGIVARCTLPPPGGAAWRLTPLGERLEPVVLALGSFGAHWLDRPAAGDRFDARWALLSLRHRYRPGPPGRVEVWVADRPFALVFGPDGLRSTDGPLPGADAVLRLDAATFPAVFVHLELPQAGLTGDADVVRSLLAHLDPVAAAPP